MEDISELLQQLVKLFKSQRFCVLATQYEGQPYSNLVAFAEADDLKNLIFITSRNTRKYKNAISNNKVAVMIDSRTNGISDFSSVIAVTAIGTVEEPTETERCRLASIYISRHPNLTEFANGPEQAVMKIKVNDYIVARFDSVQVIHM